MVNLKLNLLVFFEVDSSVGGCNFFPIDDLSLFHPAWHIQIIFAIVIGKGVKKKYAPFESQNM